MCARCTIYQTGLAAANGLVLTKSTGEASRWPGAETRLALAGGKTGGGFEVGVGGLFAPHRSIGGNRLRLMGRNTRLSLAADGSHGSQRGCSTAARRSVGWGAARTRTTYFELDNGGYYFKNPRRNWRLELRSGSSG